MKYNYSDEPITKKRKNDDAIALLLDGKTLLDLTRKEVDTLRSAIWKMYGKGHAYMKKQSNGLFSVGLSNKERD